MNCERGGGGVGAHPNSHPEHQIRLKLARVVTYICKRTITSPDFREKVNKTNID